MLSSRFSPFRFRLLFSLLAGPHPRSLSLGGLALRSDCGRGLQSRPHQVGEKRHVLGERGQVRVSNTGRLYLSVNDDYLQDNSGEYRVTLTVR